MATIRDIAQKAGVSTATVSRVLNDSGWVSEDLKQRVYRAIKETGYSPNPVARSLSRKRSNVITLIVPDIDSYFFPEVLRSVEREANRRGYSVILGNSANEAKKEQQYLEMAVEMWAAGIILTPTSKHGNKYYRSIGQRVPLVVLDRPIADPEVAFVSGDHFLGAYQATKHLLKLGHRQIAFIKGLDVESSDLRFKAYCAALAESGLEVDHRLVKQGDFGLESGRKAAEELLDSGLRPTAIQSANDMMAIGVLKALAARGLKVPRDVSLIGFDDIELCKLVDPPLTTVVQPIEEIGRVATNLLIDMIENKLSGQNQVFLPVNLVERKSCARYRRSSARTVHCSSVKSDEVRPEGVILR